MRGWLVDPLPNSPKKKNLCENDMADSKDNK